MRIGCGLDGVLLIVVVKKEYFFYFCLVYVVCVVVEVDVLFGDGFVVYCCLVDVFYEGLDI